MRRAARSERARPRQVRVPRAKAAKGDHTANVKLRIYNFGI